jgi:hypothetical protein
MMQAPTPTDYAQPQYEITDKDRARQKTIAEAWTAYDGELDPPLEPMEDQPDDNVLTNRCKQVVRRAAAFLFGKELEISCEEGAPQEAQDLINTVWDIKEKRIPLLIRLRMNGGISGCAFLRIVPGRQKGTFRLVEIDPSTIFLKTAPQDCQTVLLYCIEYSEEGIHLGKPTAIYYREEIRRIDPEYQTDTQEALLAAAIDQNVTWEIQHWTRIGDRGPWEATGDPIPWPYPFSPIFYCQNLARPNTVWGEADLTPDLIKLNEALNLTSSSINRNIKIYGQPVLWGKGLGESQLDIVPGKIIILPPVAEATLGSVTITTDLTSALAFAEDLRSDIDELSSVPGVATGRLKDMPRGNVSGIALELLFMSLISKTDEQRCTYGALILDVSTALLKLANMNSEIKMTLGWQSPLPHDDLQALQAAVLKKQIGISDATIQREQGYDPEEERALSQSEDAQKLVDFSQGRGMPPSPTVPGQPAPPAPSEQPPQQPFGGQS